MRPRAFALYRYSGCRTNGKLGASFDLITIPDGVIKPKSQPLSFGVVAQSMAPPILNRLMRLSVSTRNFRVHQMSGFDDE